MNFIIKQSTPEQLTELRYLAIQTYREHFTSIWTEKGMEQYLQAQFNQEKLLSELCGANIKYFIGYLENIPVGFVKINLDKIIPAPNNESGFALEKIYLLSDFASRGLGKKMLDFVIEFARKQNAGFIWLDALKTNIRAKEFYERYGFKITGECSFSTDKMKPDMWVMRYDMR